MYQYHEHMTAARRRAACAMAALALCVLAAAGGDAGSAPTVLELTHDTMLGALNRHRRIVVLMYRGKKCKASRLFQPWLFALAHRLPGVQFARVDATEGEGSIADAFGKGVRLEVGDLVPSSAYAGIMERIPEIWPRAFDVNPAADPAVRASCAEFLLAGLHATDRISRSERFGRTIYESDR